MPRWLWSLALIASCMSPPAQSSHVAEALVPRAVTVQPADLVQGRANLEFGDNTDSSVERWPQAPIDSIAEALATLRNVDSLTRAQLAPPDFWTERWSTVGVLISDSESEPMQGLRNCVLRLRSEGIPAARAPCWPVLDSVLVELDGARIIETSDSDYPGAYLRMLVPVPYNRLRIISRIRAAHPVAASDAGRVHPFPEPSFYLSEFERVDRSVQPWQYIIERGYGDCPSGCIYRRYYVYRYDPLTRRAWKEREYGDPYPEPRPRPLPTDSGASTPK